MTELPDHIHLTSTFVPASFETSWSWLSDPLKFPAVYPEWIARVTAEDDHFTATGTGAERFDVVPLLDAEQGSADFEFVDELGNSELWRTRVLAVKNGGCVICGLAVRWRGVSDSDWLRLRTALDKSFAQMPDLLI